MKKLLLITSHFPYYPGEQFIETEISFLAESFDSVQIVPFDGDEARFRRPVPENVHVSDEVQQFMYRAKRNLISRFLALFKTTHALKEEIVARKNIIFPRPKAFANLLRVASTAGQVVSLLENIIFNYKPSIIYSYWLSSGALAASLALQNLGWDIPVISRCHGFDLYEERHCPPYCPFQRFLLSHLDAVFPISEHGRKYLVRKHGPFVKSNLKTFRLGVRGGQSATMSQDGTLHLVSCSSLTPVKRVHLIAEALELLNFPILWTHIGDGPLQKSLEAQASLLTKEKSNIQVRFTGSLPNSRVLEYYNSNPVDLFINVSSSEGIPVSIMEATSRGIPIIATDVGGTSEIVNKNTRCGFLLPENVTSYEIAKNLKAFYELPHQEKAKMKDAAYRAWQNNFEAETNYREFCQHLESLIRPSSIQR
jgi:glycosyltransferase involved in cell wall biosynthesis